jgi:hypothetical protein
LKAAKDQIQHRQSFHDHPRIVLAYFYNFGARKAGRDIQSFIFSKNKGFSLLSSRDPLLASLIKRQKNLVLTKNIKRVYIWFYIKLGNYTAQKWRK